MCTWPTGIRVVVEQADGAEFGREAGLDLLFPLAYEAAVHATILGVDVAADSDRVALVQPGVAPGASAPHQEQRALVAQHEVGNDLLPFGVGLRFAPPAVAALAREQVQIRGEVAMQDAAPRARRHQARTRHSQNELVIAHPQRVPTQRLPLCSAA